MKVDYRSATTPPDYRCANCGTVSTVREHTTETYIGGVGKDATFQTKSHGWFLYLEGSYEAIHMGAEKPEFNPGDRVKITFEKVQA